MSKLLLILIIKLNVLIARDNSDGTLTEYKTTNILPLAIIRTRQNEFIHPTDLAISMTFHANFIFGTEFFSSKRGDQLFFCGCEQSEEKTITSFDKENIDLEDEYCTYELVKPEPIKVEHEIETEPKVEHEPELFKPEPIKIEHEIELNTPETDVEYELNEEPDPNKEQPFLKCTREPQPFVKKLTEMDPNGVETEVQCGSESDEKKSKGEMFAFVYNIKSNNNQTGTFEVFKFCYDVINKRVIFTDHVIRAPALLDPNNQLFEYERSKEYEMSTKSYGNFGAEYETMEFAYTELKVEKELKTYEDDVVEKSLITHKYLLSDQKLVPTDDMAFALWRKPTDHFLNTMPMEDGKIKLWNHISEIIRNDAINKSREYRIYTGTFDMSDVGKDGSEVIQSPDFWIKIVHYKWEDDGEEKNESIAVVMIHNPKLEDVQEFFELICVENLWEDKFKETFPEYNESICCVHPAAVGSFFFDLKFHTHDVLKIDI